MNERLDRLTATELADKLRVKAATIRTWQRRGTPYVPAGRRRFFSLEKVEEWIYEQDRRRIAARERKREQDAAAA